MIKESKYDEHLLFNGELVTTVHASTKETAETIERIYNDFVRDEEIKEKINSRKDNIQCVVECSCFNGILNITGEDETKCFDCVEYSNYEPLDEN